MTHTQTTYTNRIALRAGKKGARPAEVGALASLFEKSATELKQSKLLKCKQTLQIATFNARTLNRIGQLPELIASAEEHKIDIICIQEHIHAHQRYQISRNWQWVVARHRIRMEKLCQRCSRRGRITYRTKSIKNDK